jgi:DNA gyrase subunit A
MSLDAAAGPLALGTASGVVKRVSHDVPKGEEWEVVALKAGDRVVGAAHAPDEATLVFVATDAQLLHFPAASVRPQGRAAGGMAGIKLSASAEVLFFGVVAHPALESGDPGWQGAEGTLFDLGDAPADDAAPPAGAVVVTIAGSSRTLPGTEAGSVKVTPFELYPGKGRATGGVRCQRFLRGQNTLIAAWVGPSPARAVGAGGQPIPLPAPDPRSDGSGAPVRAAIAAIG